MQDKGILCEYIDDFDFVERSKSIIKIKEGYGEGTIEVFSFNNGIEVAFSDYIITKDYSVSRVSINKKLLAVNYVISGRYECLIKNNTYLILNDKDVTLWAMSGNKFSAKY